MDKDNVTIQDELLQEYDLKRLQVRKFGPGRKSFGGKCIMQLKSDVVEVFPDSASLNEALRILTPETKENVKERDE